MRLKAIAVFISIVLIVVCNVFISMMFATFPKNVESYGERNGEWTATEKRQIIELLERIEENTRD